MSRPKFPHKPPAPSVREAVGRSIARAQGLDRDDHPMTQKDIVRDILAKVSLPESVQRELRRLHDLE
jgi:hypothetical protein